VKIFPADRQPSTQPALHETGANDDQPFIIVYHGTVDARQGLDIAIRATVQARRIVPNVRLEIKGFGEAANLKRLVAELGAGDAVVFSERCPVWEVAKFISQGHVGIMPYRSGGYMELVLPTKAFEFAWMHLPMIASNTRRIRSLFRPESIVLCNPSDPQSFAEAIIDLYQHPEKRARLAANAAEDYQAYQWERMAKLYQQLLASLGRRRLKKEVTLQDCSSPERLVP
jgi:glycosyltransferase involved in cell wall biosynthesis